MTQFCFDINNPLKKNINQDLLKTFVQNIYTNSKFEDSFKEYDDDLPFITIYAKNENHICIIITSKGKKTLERIENINSKLIPTDLIFSSNINIVGPHIFDVDKQTWWGEHGEDQDEQNNKWTSLIHQGPYFPNISEPYKPIGAVLIYDNKSYNLNPVEERIASFYARRIISENDGGVVELLTKDNIFNTNFWNDFITYLTPAHKKIFKKFSKVDFSDIVQKLKNKKEIKDTKSEKRIKKILTEEKKRNYGYGYIDNRREKIGNYSVELSSLFFGRGDNPKRGKIKPDIIPENITINIGINDPVPKPPIGHKWGSVIHDNNAIWLSKWKDPITESDKYIFFSAEGQFKGQGDLLKYEKSRKLAKHIDEIRHLYKLDSESNGTSHEDIVKKQLGTVLYLIDNLGIRVGNETKEDESDTFGATTLLVSHVTVGPYNHIIFDFLGKDSIRFYKDVVVPKYIHDNIKSFRKNKKKDTELFDHISSRTVNDYIKKFDKSFTAKVFRTRLASFIIYNALKTVTIPIGSTKSKTKILFNEANTKVATVLNHTRNVSQKNEESLLKIQNELDILEEQKKVLEDSGKKTDQIIKKINTKKENIKNKTDTQNVAITTSLTNYIDPRIVISWAEKENVDISAIYSTTLQKKFNWALSSTTKDWDYFNTPIIGNPELEPEIKSKIIISQRNPQISFKLNIPIFNQNDMKKLLDFCKNPIPISNIKKVPTEILRWFYRASKEYMINNGGNNGGNLNLVNKYIVDYYDIIEKPIIIPIVLTNISDYYNMIRSSDHKNDLFLFYDKEEYSDNELLCNKGSDSAIIRPFKLLDPPRSYGIVIGSIKNGIYKILNENNKKFIDKSINYIKYLISRYFYKRIYFLVDINGKIDTENQLINQDVINYITTQLNLIIF